MYPSEKNQYPGSYKLIYAVYIVNIDPLLFERGTPDTCEIDPSLIDLQKKKKVLVLFFLVDCLQV